eukprot:scaffold243604_cov31-Tisochrysis_lutea.AAC.1
MVCKHSMKLLLVISIAAHAVTRIQAQTQTLLSMLRTPPPSPSTQLPNSTPITSRVSLQTCNQRACGCQCTTRGQYTSCYSNTEIQWFISNNLGGCTNVLEELAGNECRNVGPIIERAFAGTWSSTCSESNSYSSSYYYYYYSDSINIGVIVAAVVSGVYACGWITGIILLVLRRTPTKRVHSETDPRAPVSKLEQIRRSILDRLNSIRPSASGIRRPAATTQPTIVTELTAEDIE